MVGQTPAEQKNVSPQMTIVCTRRGKYNLGRTYISLTGFLSLISGQKDCLTSLRCLNLALLGQTTAPLCQTTVLPPYDLGKEKSCHGKTSSSSFVFLSCTHVCHLAGIYIDFQLARMRNVNTFHEKKTSFLICMVRTKIFQKLLRLF